jgi:hypothetical protein
MIDQESLSFSLMLHKRENEVLVLFILSEGTQQLQMIFVSVD